MRILLAIFAALTLAACSPGEAGTLPTAKITVTTAEGQSAFTVEVAADDASRRRGLMGRTHLDADAGMLFDYHTSQPVAFWMKDTKLPLDMIFIRADGTICAIVADTTPYSETHIPSLEPVRAVLEINGGLSRTLGIKPGDIVHATIFGNATDGSG